MSLAPPLPPSSPAGPFFNFRSLADHQDLVMHFPVSCGLSASTLEPRIALSPAPHNWTAFADIFSPRLKLHSPTTHSSLGKALSSPRSLSILRTDCNTAKENRGDGSGSPKSGSTNRAPIERKRPARLAIPESARLASLRKAEQFILPDQADSYQHEVELFGVAAKRGRKDCMEDFHTAATYFQGNSKQAFFGVFDGHGGKQAAEFAAANLSRHVSAALQNQDDGKTCVEDAMHIAYRNTDVEFLNQRVSSGTCAVSVLVKDREMVVANAGDCKAVLCRSGKAESLSTLHRASNVAERQRVENLGGFVDCYNGTWRLQATLAVTRGFGDAHLKRWVSAEPSTRRREITKDCEFLVLASDGLWDQMSDQEVVDCARKILREADRDTQANTLTPMSEHKYPATSLLVAKSKEGALQASSPSHKINACNELIRIASHRGNLDDITVMIVPLRTFATTDC